MLMVDVLAGPPSAEDGPDAWGNTERILQGELEWWATKRAAMDRKEAYRNQKMERQETYRNQKLKVLVFGEKRQTAEMLVGAEPGLLFEAALEKAERLMG